MVGLFYIKELAVLHDMTLWELVKLDYSIQFELLKRVWWIIPSIIIVLILVRVYYWTEYKRRKR